MNLRSPFYRQFWRSIALLSPMRSGFYRASIGFDRPSPIPPYTPMAIEAPSRAHSTRLRPRCAGAPLRSNPLASSRTLPADLNERDFTRDQYPQPHCVEVVHARVRTRMRAEPSSVPRLIDTNVSRSPTWSIAPRDALKRGVVVKSAPLSVACYAIVALVLVLGKRMGTWARLCIDIRPAASFGASIGRICARVVSTSFALSLRDASAKPRPLAQPNAQLFPGFASIFSKSTPVGENRPPAGLSTNPLPTRPRAENVVPHD
jgi:hypothetical protein